jgi:hypothetical protein
LFIKKVCNRKIKSRSGTYCRHGGEHQFIKRVRMAERERPLRVHGRITLNQTLKE